MNQNKRNQHKKLEDIRISIEAVFEETGEDGKEG